MFGALLAFASAAFFGLNNATVRRGVLKSTVLQGMAITVPLGVPLFVACALFMGGFEAMAGWPVPTYLWMIAAGVIHFVVGRYGNYRATQALGATLSTPVQQLSILIALVLGFMFLGETVNAVNVLGIVLVIVGPMMLMRRKRAVTKAGSAKAFVPEYGPGLFWGAVCAFGYGTSPLFIALGIEAAGGDLADGVAGLLVSYVAATLVVAVLVLLAGGRSYMQGLDGGSRGWFLASALFVALSQLFRYLALAVAPVAVVVPIQRLSVVFRLIFNAMINREHEVFDAWVIASILLAVLGAVALAGDTAMLLGALGVGQDAIAVLSAPLV
ncbi:EamA-like transporter family protein [Roseivivax jejudonensis]|uniref:EamA-like transporter family protein n=1 Tax=Roseivivax jejudonensis TaxID=1529041 RepID=A0A1X6ZXC4_9RHOB|nr:EamA family transporter [Roseivivax jejudonensis]SLN64154.1 EamA-like transporter family protein [Roseivivax jejudonensis]